MSDKKTIEADIVIPADKVGKVTYVELNKNDGWTNDPKMLKALEHGQFNEKELIDRLDFALERAAEEAYQNEMVDTNSYMTEIREFAEKYEYYANADDKRITIENCEWATKEEWIKEKINVWLYDYPEED